MAFIHYRQRTKTNYVPSDYNANETVEVINVGAGDVVTGAFVNVTVLYDGTNVIVELGDGSGSSGYIADGQSAVDSATGLKIGAGTYLQSAPGAKIYTSIDTIDINYTLTASNSTDVGKSDWWIWFTKANPH